MDLFTYMAATSWYWPCNFLYMYAIHLDFTTFITLVFNSMQLDTRQKQKKYTRMSDTKIPTGCQRESQEHFPVSEQKVNAP